MREKDFVDEIYESAFRPELWPGVLDELSAMVAGRGGVLFTARARVLSWTASPRLHDTFAAYLTDGWLARCTRKACLLSRACSGFLVEDDIWTREELDDNPVYRDFLRPRGLGWSAGTALRMPTDDNLVISLERDYAAGPVEAGRVARLNELLPHIGRSAFIGARLQLAEARGAADSLAALGLPALVVDAAGAVRAMNALCEDLRDQLGLRARDVVALQDKAAQALLESGLARLAARESPVALSFPLRDRGGAPLKVAHLVPIRRSAGEVFPQSAALLVVTPVAHPEIPSIDLLRSLFDLTPSEAKVARAVAKGRSLQEIAAASEVSIHTVRFHIKSVLDKTGCRRQADLTRLLASLPIRRGGA